MTVSEEALQAMTDEESNALIAECERQAPELARRMEAMTDEEFERFIEKG